METVANYMRTHFLFLKAALALDLTQSSGFQSGHCLLKPQVWDLTLPDM